MPPRLIVRTSVSGTMCCWNSTSNLVTNWLVQSISQKIAGNCLQSRNPPTQLSGWLAPVSDIAPCTSMFHSKESTRLLRDKCSMRSLTHPSLSTKEGTLVMSLWLLSTLVQMGSVSSFQQCELLLHTVITSERLDSKHRSTVYLTVLHTVDYVHYWGMSMW